uniref:Prefoldin subunit 4 n=1 Tax=Romanomermis culicivorax TaxID=13658 RepID=A0A915J1V2_ROMCU
MNSSSKSAVGSLKHTDVEVTSEDQDKINAFARLNQKMEEIVVSIKFKQKTVQDLSYACDEILLQDDDTHAVPIMMGEAFLSFNQQDAQDELEKLKDSIDKEIITLNGQAEKIKAQMAKLKVDLYAKFGSSINLEAAD